MKLLYCVAGPVQFVVDEDKIISRGQSLIHSSEAYSITFVPSSVSKIGGDKTLTFDISILKNVHLNCSLICSLEEGDPLYPKILDLQEKMKARTA